MIQFRKYVVKNVEEEKFSIERDPFWLSPRDAAVESVTGYYKLNVTVQRRDKTKAVIQISFRTHCNMYYEWEIHNFYTTPQVGAKLSGILRNVAMSYVEKKVRKNRNVINSAQYSQYVHENTKGLEVETEIFKNA